MKNLIISFFCLIILASFAPAVFPYCSSLDPATYYACQQRENQHNQMMQMQQQQMLMQQQYMNQQRQFQQQQQEYQKKLLDMQKQQMQQPVYVPQYSQGGNKYCTGFLEGDYYEYVNRMYSIGAHPTSKEEFAKACHYDY